MAGPVLPKRYSDQYSNFPTNNSPVNLFPSNAKINPAASQSLSVGHERCKGSDRKRTFIEDREASHPGKKKRARLQITSERQDFKCQVQAFLRKNGLDKDHKVAKQLSEMFTLVMSGQISDAYSRARSFRDDGRDVDIGIRKQVKHAYDYLDDPDVLPQDLHLPLDYVQFFSLGLGVYLFASSSNPLQEGCRILESLVPKLNRHHPCCGQFFDLCKAVMDRAVENGENIPWKSSGQLQKEWCCSKNNINLPLIRRCAISELRSSNYSCSSYISIVLLLRLLSEHLPVGEQKKRLEYMTRDAINALFQCRDVPFKTLYTSTLGALKFFVPEEQALEIGKRAFNVISKNNSQHSSLLDTFATCYGTLPCQSFQDLILRKLKTKDDFRYFCYDLAALKSQQWPTGALCCFALAFARANLYAINHFDLTTAEREKYHKEALTQLGHVCNRKALGFYKAQLYCELGEYRSALRAVNATKQAALNSRYPGQPDWGIAYDSQAEALEQKIRNALGEATLDTGLSGDATLETYIQALDHKAQAEQELEATRVESAQKHMAYVREHLIAKTRTSERDRALILVEELQKEEEERLLLIDCENDELRKQHQAMLSRYSQLLVQKDLSDQVLEHCMGVIASLKARVETLRTGNGILESDFYVEKSEQRNAGNGLKTKHAIKSGFTIGEYFGAKVYRVWLPLCKRFAAWTVEDNGIVEPLTTDTYVLWLVDEVADKGRIKVPHRKGQIEEGILASENCVFRFMNHDSKPNVEVKIVASDTGVGSKASLSTVRPVGEDEELTWNYDPGHIVDFEGFASPMVTDPDEFHSLVIIDKQGKVQLREPNSPSS